jgi:hypothetical protein
MKTWQAQLGFWGSVIWWFTFEGSKYANAHGWINIHQGISGYMIGYITALGGALFLEILHGRGKRLISDAAAVNIGSFFPLAIVFIISICGLINEVSGSTSIWYNISFLISGFVMSQGVIPTMNYLDGHHQYA